MASTNSTFFDTDYPELRKAISDIIESIAQFPQEEKGKLFEALSEQVREMNLKDLGLAINDQGLQKEVNKELFIKLIEEALKGLTSENVDSKIIEEALKSVNQQAISNVINNNKGPLDNLVNYFKSASANKKIGIASTGIVLGVAFSPLIVLATLIALVAIGARYVGIGIGKAGEKIKEGAIEAGKAVKSSYKDLIDKLPEVQRRENNFEKLISNLMEKNLEADEGERTMLSNEIKIIKMLQNQKQLAAIGQLIREDKAGLLHNLMSKGTSTHEEDMEKLVDFMSEVQPAIMAIGENDIKEVERKINEKAQEMKPKFKLDDPNSEKAADPEEHLSP
ncbi:hypothetical protein [Wolbachia endosymbiont of Ctenocephalides felis wCfeJ]|uniref:hypothetical protein n=1 Tax=Wolbachia endosymbiont of Ctenocephalides felis wCfeJ TaxID=2732594 RepID=UPI001444E305|nr:hypothetical protein [Wolbachia endosymbiont of Ctenocephalides felis wCfeJ]WCR58029.1 MAG: hypothetical protein PG980_000501 [Wolbachia endosymbiont of Ctenocephalides felis wCfeJ]